MRNGRPIILVPMFNAENILNRLESVPFFFSVVHRFGGGADTNRRAFVNLVRPGATVVEIGANKGSYTSLLSRLVGENGRVHAFEPVTESFDRLSARVKSFDLTNVRCWKTAIGDGSVSTAEMIIPAEDSQQASLVAHSCGSWAGNVSTETESVEITSLDTFLTEHNIGVVDFIKLDVEGAELSVLRGGHGCFTRSKPILHIEINSDWLRDFGTTAFEVAQLLRSYGYGFCYKIDSAKLKGFRDALELNDANSSKVHVCGDFVFSAKRL